MSRRDDPYPQGPLLGRSVARRLVLRGSAVVGASGLTGWSLSSCASNEVAAAGSRAGGGSGVIARTSDIPLRGGKIFEEEKVVITQPGPGDFRCFSAVCTHLGCILTDVRGGTMNCWCHGSLFDIADGAVEHGPARRPLPRVPIRLEGDRIRLS
jgi:nitrite reductase/ring-hydroxylating ferredoxin subunit